MRLNFLSARICLTSMLTLFAATPLIAAGAQTIDARTITTWRTFNRGPALVDTVGRTILRFPEAPSDGVAWTSAIDVSDGDIDVDVRGRDVLQKSFLGVVFRVANDTTFDLVYLRPFNFASTDTARHAHAVQYTSYPTFPWERLRSEHPGAYESAVHPQPRAADWVHLRVSFRGTDVTVFLDNSATPTLHVQSLGGRSHGGIGLWVGDASNGDFANLRVTAAK
jgi:hypothetical protein